MADENLLKKYAELVVRVGANVQEGQDLAIYGMVEHAPFARALTEAAYEAGARYVAAFYGDQYVKRQLILHGDDETIEWSPPWELERLEHFARSERIFIADQELKTRSSRRKVRAHPARRVSLDECVDACCCESALRQLRLDLVNEAMNENEFRFSHSRILRRNT